MDQTGVVRDDKSIYSLDLDRNISLPPLRPRPPNFKVTDDSNTSFSNNKETNSAKSIKSFERNNSLELKEMPKKSNFYLHKENLSHSTSIESMPDNLEENQQVTASNTLRSEEKSRNDSNQIKKEAFSNEILSSIESIPGVITNIENIPKLEQQLEQHPVDFSINDYLNKYSFTSLDEEAHLNKGDEKNETPEAKNEYEEEPKKEVKKEDEHPERNEASYLTEELKS